MTPTKIYITFLSLTLVCLFNPTSYAQETRPFAEQWEVYGIEVTFKEKIYSSKIRCGTGWQSDSEQTLYKIELNSNLFSRDTTVYSASQLLDTEYIILPTKTQIEINKTYYLTAGNSSVREYLVGFRTFDQETLASIDNGDAHSYLQGLEVCYKLNIWDKICILFGASKSRIYSKRKRLKIDNVFYRKILEHKAQNKK